jgi:two-component system LytT family sensor kinase
LPFLALQQLVDNAVRNGIECQQLGGTVTVAARRDGGDCVITVTDDGPGTVDPDVAASLRTIDDKLQDRFGAHYRLLPDATPGIGTTITMRVPASHLSGE